MGDFSEDAFTLDLHSGLVRSFGIVDGQLVRVQWGSEMRTTVSFGRNLPGQFHQFSDNFS